MKSFYEGKFNPLSKREKKLLEEFKDREHAFYIIGTHKNVNNFKSDIEHEFAHGLFYTDKDYREEVDKELEKYDISELEEKIRSRGYYGGVVKDEIQAHLVESVEDEINSEFKQLAPNRLIRNLKAKYNKYINKNNFDLNIKWPKKKIHKNLKI